MNHYDNGQIELNDWTAERVTVGQGRVYGMTEREGYENPTNLSGDISLKFAHGMMPNENSLQRPYSGRTFQISLTLITQIKYIKQIVYISCRTYNQKTMVLD